MSLESALNVEVYEYPMGTDSGLPSWDGFGPASPESALKIPVQQDSPAPQEACLHTEAELEAEGQRKFEAGRQIGFNEGRNAERETQDAALRAAAMQYQNQLGELIEKFASGTERYLQEIEREVVELALAIAARILRREAQMDPLLLTGAVRVALGQLSRGAKVCLKVPASELGLWRDAIAHIPNLALKPEVIVGEGLRRGDCEMETELGSVDLGIRAQLGEIENGFFDRPTSMDAPSAAHAGPQPTTAQGNVE